MAGSGLLGNSAVPQYVKITATGILGLTYLSALAVTTIDMLKYGPDAPVPAVVSFILGTGLSLALGVLGLHQGASLAEAVPPNVTIQPAQTTQANMTPAAPAGLPDNANTASAAVTAVAQGNTIGAQGGSVDNASTATA